MPSKIEIVFSAIDHAGRADASGSLANQLVDASKNNNQGFNLVNQDAQLIATFTNAVPFLQPIAIQTNLFAGTTTVLKMSMDLQDGKGINPGDALTLVGNVAGVVAAVAVFAAAPEVVAVATVVGVVADVAGLIVASDQENVANFTNNLVSVNWPSLPDPSDVWYLTDTNQVLPKSEIEAQGLHYGVMVVTPDGTELGTATESSGTVDTGDGQSGDSDSDSDDGDSDGDSDSDDGDDTGGDSGGDSGTMFSQA
ncbi:hypothetical protein [Xanthomonas sp. NCPPB 2632]|uniref:hypothetical protein n=1 Tax=Xanthomonas sp. NCPPB 2632 TaxID=3240912 RepID=UPI003512C956